MKKIYIIILFAFGVSFYGCNKDKTHKSLLGSWNCEEFMESDIYASSKYQVNIERNNDISGATNQYKIFNFHQLGFDKEQAVFFMQDSTGKLIITGTEVVNIDIQGTGVVASDFSTIDWTYSINDNSGIKAARATYY